ncbi:MAG: ABC-F family ATP-binding cassette domain-containing protein [Cytophagaceae bacterium]|nr:ABC-F family ATP-binding cassette domain-containing protein [Cytophagaceae bacterium]
MNYISAENVSKSFNEKILFQNISIGLSRGDKAAIVGRNGAGKSTLLHILAGKDQADEGKVVIRKEIRVGILDQDPHFEGNQSVLDTLFSQSNPALAAIKEYESALVHPENKGLQEAMEKMDTLNAWDYEHKVKQIISRMGLPDFDQKTSTLSGGQTKRLALAKLLIEEPELIIMDEPTNHLDLETVEWLEDYLSSQNTTLLLVTHDRYFLDRVANQIIELENGKLYPYKGNYSYFVEKKAEREVQEQTEIDKAKNLLKKELDWMRRQPKARGTKSKSRIDAFYELKDKATDKRSHQKLELDVKTTRQGNKIIEMDSVSKSFNSKKLIDDFSYNFRKKDRIGIVGKNGIGKSTFLNMLSGAIKPDAGTITLGETTVVGYFSQKGLEIKEDKRVIEVVKEIAEVITLSNGEKVTIGKFLEHFLFPPAMQYTFVSKLSGGEKKRLQLLLILVKNPNFLILDEPTNDLDIDTMNVLEDFLLSFEGSLLIVSHDRYFMDRLTDHLFVFEGDGVIKDFPGNYTDYRTWAEERDEKLKELQKVKEAPKAITATNTEEKKKLSFAEKKEYEKLEKEIAELEIKKRALIEKLDSGENSFDEINRWSIEIGNLTEEIDLKTLRWLELSEKN